ncbi:Fic family protein [Owenweeksia hongkongensis]|uniref:Fic family protein n=1 Tax=Owenweeksia hongkongensis TaxID=253245 RepID=UPI003A929B57
MKTFESGQIISQGHYKSFEPNPINRQWLIDDPEIQSLLSQADRQLGRLDMFSEYAPNIDLFISMHVVKEATKSSKIEGTQTNMEEALLEEKDVPVEKKDDWEEVQNYIRAMNYAVEHLQKLPFSTRLIRETHGVLLQGVRGKTKQPGQFRTSQNWIGGAAISDAAFVPPVFTSVPTLMGDLEKFAHNTDVYVPDLIKIAIIHYQFETIHPFLDGNGRIGRLLIPFFLVSRDILKKPILYMSDFLEKNRQLYYDNLMRTRTHHDIRQWLKFFLTGLIETAKNGVNTFNAILQLKNETEEKVTQKLGARAHNAQKLLNHLYARPIISASHVAQATNLSMASAYKLIHDLEELGILKELTGEKRGRLYSFESYLNLYQR